MYQGSKPSSSLILRKTLHFSHKLHSRRQDFQFRSTNTIDFLRFYVNFSPILSISLIRVYFASSQCYFSPLHPHSSSNKAIHRIIGQRFLPFRVVSQLRTCSQAISSVPKSVSPDLANQKQEMRFPRDIKEMRRESEATPFV